MLVQGWCGERGDHCSCERVLRIDDLGMEDFLCDCNGWSVVLVWSFVPSVFWASVWHCDGGFHVIHSWSFCFMIHACYFSQHNKLLRILTLKPHKP